MAQHGDKTIKVCLTNGGEDSETPWAHDLGPASGPKGSRKVRLVNVPFLHAKPTWGDVIVVSPVSDGFPTWDRSGVAWPQIGTRIHEDGGRWAMIVDYVPHGDDRSGDIAYRALAMACEAADIVCEGAWGPGKAPGRTYLAVRNEHSAEQVMATLRDGALPCELIQVHPSSGVGRRASGQKAPKTKSKPKATAQAKAKKPKKPAKAKAKPRRR